MTEHAVYVIIPAAPGFETLTYFHNNGGADACIDRQPVVAWRIDPTEAEWAEPITPDTEYRDKWVIKYPDGSVCRVADRTWDSEALWLADMTAQGEQRKIA